jgi:hypothetical protein
MTAEMSKQLLGDDPKYMANNKGRRRFSFVRQIVIFFGILLISTSCNHEAEQPVAIHLFKFENTAISVPIDKNDENGWLPLLEVDLNQSDFVINESDISSYDWNSQKISLNDDLTERFEYRTIGDTDIVVFAYSYFILALGDEPVVGGIILPEISAVGSRIPVLHISHTIEFPEIDFENANLEMVLLQHGYLHVEEESSFIDDQNEQLNKRLLEIGTLIEEQTNCQHRH